MRTSVFESSLLELPSDPQPGSSAPAGPARLPWQQEGFAGLGSGAWWDCWGWEHPVCQGPGRQGASSPTARQSSGGLGQRQPWRRIPSPAGFWSLTSGKSHHLWAPFSQLLGRNRDLSSRGSEGDLQR